MGREIKRVPVDWDWPLEKRWEGYVNPYYVECPNEDCDSGQTYDGWWLQNLLYVFGMMAEAGEYPATPLHPWLQEFPLAHSRYIGGKAEFRRLYPFGGGRMPPRDVMKVVRPSPAFTEFFRALVGIKDEGRGNWRPQYAQESHKLYRRFTEMANIPKFGSCPTCGGDGIDPEYQARHDTWERTEPPTGEGWQVWETVSEGSPITPVFPTSEELVDYLATYGTLWDQKSSFGGAKGPWRREAAESFVKTGWAVSFITIKNESGVQMFEGGRDDDKLAATRETP